MSGDDSDQQEQWWVFGCSVALGVYSQQSLRL